MILTIAFFYNVNQSYNDILLNNDKIPKWSWYEDGVLIDDFTEFLKLKKIEHIRSEYDIYMRLYSLSSNITRNF